MSEFGNRITIDPAICHGKPTIRGLRYPVETILERLSSGMTSDEILDGYPGLEREDISQCSSTRRESSGPSAWNRLAA
ncbi:MAG TPA: DUF433 domain-containing protein [Longimicrobium sp.]|nr:DUF433 domain-containing protein [Longimicrobium sp.]